MASLTTDAAPTAALPQDSGAGNPVAPVGGWQQLDVKTTWFDRAEAFVSRLSTRDNFWSRILSFIYLPLAFFSGIRMKKLDATTFAAYLPFTRFNRNWYRAMAGGALLGNAEIAGGMYVFGYAGGDYTVVCKRLNYTFLRPCLGPALYKMTPRENLRALVDSKAEFNVTLDMEVVQQSLKAGERERRVGKADVTFHVTPKVHHKRRLMRKQQQLAADAAATVRPGRA